MPYNNNQFGMNNLAGFMQPQMQPQMRQQQSNPMQQFPQGGMMGGGNPYQSMMQRYQQMMQQRQMPQRFQQQFPQQNLQGMMGMRNYFGGNQFQPQNMNFAGGTSIPIAPEMQRQMPIQNIQPKMNDMRAVLPSQNINYAGGTSRPIDQMLRAETMPASPQMKGY